MKKCSVFLIIFIFGYTIGKEEVRSLCDYPIIYAANRLPNNTYRVYRDNHYWELSGLPNRVAKPTGPFRITAQYMAPVDRDTSIMTVLSGDITGNTWKFRGDRFWQWNEKGSLEVGGKGGVKWKEIPKGGFHCAMSDGNRDKTGPKMIALKAIKAYYWKTNRKIFAPIGDIYNGYIDGQFGEEFPPDVTACMTFPSTDPTIKYFLYLFKREKYCFRQITGEKGCAEWRSNKELFGCGDGPPRSVALRALARNEGNPDEVVVDPSTTTPRSASLSVSSKKISLLFAFYLFLIFI